MKRWLAVIAVLAGCDDLKTAEGCPIYLSELMQAETEACQAAYHEEMARQRGGVVSKCFSNGSGGMTCATY